MDGPVEETRRVTISCGDEILSRLTLRGMLETAVGNRAQEFGLQQKVAETCRMDADVGTLLVDILASGRGVALLAVGGSGGGFIVELVVRVVDEVLLGRHVGEFCL